MYEYTYISQSMHTYICLQVNKKAIQSYLTKKKFIKKVYLQLPMSLSIRSSLEWSSSVLSTDAILPAQLRGLSRLGLGLRGLGLGEIRVRGDKG
jgi:hypothetical protein